MLRRHGWPAFLCLQEVKIAPSDESSQRQLTKAANEAALPDEPLYEAVFSLPRDRFNARGFGGKVHGVATLYRKDLGVFRTRKPGWDLEGRILLHELSCGLVVMNGYWINGTDHPYRNPHTGEPAGTRHDLKIRYHREILKEVLAYQGVGKPVVLVGDMNVARSRIDGHPNLRTSPYQHVVNRKDFNERFFEDEDGMRAIDIFRHLHSDARKYTWHSTSHAHGSVCDRVDYVIVSRLLTESNAIADTDICDNAADKLHSDHVPIWVDIDLSKVGNAPTEPADQDGP
jgi:exonuclease III